MNLTTKMVICTTVGYLDGYASRNFATRRIQGALRAIDYLCANHTGSNVKYVAVIGADDAPLHPKMLDVWRCHVAQNSGS